MSGEVSTDSGLDPTEIHDVLRNSRRRLVLKQLIAVGEPIELGELAEHIAAIEYGESPPPHKLRQSVYVSLHQTHIPKLTDLDIIAYNDTDKMVMLSGHAPDIAIYLEIVPQDGLSRTELFAGLSLLGVLATVGSSIGVPILEMVEPGWWSLLALFCIGILAGHYSFTQEPTLFERVR